MLPDFHRRPLIRLSGASILYLKPSCEEREVYVSHLYNFLTLPSKKQIRSSLQCRGTETAISLPEVSENCSSIWAKQCPDYLLSKRNGMSWHKLLYQLNTLQRSPFHNVKPQRAALRKPAVVELKVWPLDSSTVLVLCVCDSHWHQLKSPAHEESRISDKKCTMWIWEQSILLCQIIAPSGNINWILVTIRAESIHWNYYFVSYFTLSFQRMLVNQL